MPYHISFSIDNTKDVLFTLGATLFGTAIYKTLFGINKRFDNIVLFIGGCIFGTFRSNGIIALGIIASVFLITKFWIKNRRVFFSVVMVLLFSVIINSGLKFILNAEDALFINTINIPIQQISRVVYDEKELSDSEREEIEKIVDLDRVRIEYNPTVSDNMKALLKEKGNLIFHIL